MHSGIRFSPVSWLWLLSYGSFQVQRLNWDFSQGWLLTLHRLWMWKCCLGVLCRSGCLLQGWRRFSLHTRFWSYGEAQVQRLILFWSQKCRHYLLQVVLQFPSVALEVKLGSPTGMEMMLRGLWRNLLMGWWFDLFNGLWWMSWDFCSVADNSVALGGSGIIKAPRSTYLTLISGWMLSFTWTQGWDCHHMIYWRWRNIYKSILEAELDPTTGLEKVLYLEEPLKAELRSPAGLRKINQFWGVAWMLI